MIEYVPISALQHIVFCERQFALIHIEREWMENDLTIVGNEMHVRVDSAPDEHRKGVTILRRVFLQSESLGLTGFSDVVETRRDASGSTVYYPVEYKSGTRQVRKADDVQLCAQALCLEEMLDVQIKNGAVAYLGSQKRREVIFDSELREVTQSAAKRAHVLFEQLHTPIPAKEFPYCKSCSLREICLPKVVSSKGHLKKYIQSLYEA